MKHGAKAIISEKPIAFTLEEADLMVSSCAQAGASLVCGAITTSHPSFDKAKELVENGALGKVRSIEAGFLPFSAPELTHFIDSPPAWVSGTGDQPRRENGSHEFVGQGMMVTQKGQVVHYRPGGSMIRVSGEEGEITFDRGHGMEAVARREGALGPEDACEDALAGSPIRGDLRSGLLPG